MVGPFGEVLVLDWGVAKMIADPEPAAPPPIHATMRHGGPAQALPAQ